MQDLGCGVATEITDAGSLFLYCCGQLFGGDSLAGVSSILELMILAIKTVKGTGMIKDGQIVAAMFRAFGDGISRVATACTAGTDKISHAVSGEGIIVVGKISLVRAPTSQLPILHPSKPAKSHTTLGDPALVKAELAGDSGVGSWRDFRKTIRFPGTSVNFFDFRPKILKVGPDAINAKTYYVGYD